MERKLASIQRIVKLEPIEGADKIEVATVLGWNCVVKKGDFKEGDLVIFFEVDSLIPFCKWSEFLFKNSREGTFRLRTIRLRGQISQGLVLPMSVLEDIAPGMLIDVGDDVSEILGVEKYEPTIPAQLQGICKSTFPSYIPKTDEIRIQNVPEILTSQRGTLVYATEKIDGCSMTAFINNGDFNVCSRNMNLKEAEENSYWQMARQLNLEEKLKSLGNNIVLQGELFGNGIQGNKYKLSDRRFYIYNAYDIDYGKYFDWSEFRELVNRLELNTVPFISQFYFSFDNMSEVVNFSKRQSSINAETPIEGMVIRSVKEKTDVRGLGRLSFKIINPEFLLKYGE